MTRKPFDPHNKFDLRAEAARVKMTAALGESVITQDEEALQATLYGYCAALLGLAMIAYGSDKKTAIEQLFIEYIPHAADQAFGIMEFGRGGNA